MPSFESREPGGVILETPPPQKLETRRAKNVPPPPSEDTSYLKKATKEDHARALRTVAFQEISKAVASPQEFTKRIDEKEYERLRFGVQSYVQEGEKEKENFSEAEIAIIDELPSPSGYEEFRFYIARRIKKGEVFKPETVLVAQHKDRALTYLASYSSSDSDAYDALNEKRFLSLEDRSILAHRTEETATGSKMEAIAMTSDVAGKGGEGTVRTALRRLKEKFFPDRGVVKQHHGESELAGLKPEADLIVPLQQFLAHGGEGARYIAQPRTIIAKEESPSTTHRTSKDVFWELVSVEDAEEERTVILNLHEALENDILTDDQKMTALLHLFRGLDFLAKHGITHGDIKPSNLFLTNEQLKIGDFGLMLFNKERMDPKYRNKAQGLSSVYAYDEKGVVCGTPLYIHPRRQYGSGLFPDQIDPKHDVFSAAMMAMRMLTGYRIPRRFLENFVYAYQDLKKEIDRMLDRYLDDHPEAQELVVLLKQGLTEAQSMIKPPKVEDILPAAEEFVQVLEAMGVNESLAIKLSENESALLTTALRRSFSSKETTVSLAK